MLDRSPRRRRRDLRFVRHYVVVRRPFAEVERAMLSGASAWLPSIAEQARDHAVGLLLELGVERALLSGSSEVKVGRPRRTKQATRLPFEVWVGPAEGRSNGAGRKSDYVLRLMFVGQFEIAAIGPNSTQIAVTASYQPLAGVLKAIGGGAVVHRVAEAAVREFMERLGTRLSRG